MRCCKLAPRRFGSMQSESSKPGSSELKVCHRTPDNEALPGDLGQASRLQIRSSFEQEPVKPGQCCSKSP